MSKFPFNTTGYTPLKPFGSKMGDRKINENNSPDLNYSFIAFDASSELRSADLNEMQENTDYMARLGLTSSVSPSNMFNILKTSAYKIFNDYKEQGLNMNEAMKEIEDFIDFAGFIKVGPSSINKQGVKVQKDLKSYITNEILTLKKDLYKDVNDANKQEKDFAEQAELADIDSRLD